MSDQTPEDNDKLIERRARRGREYAASAGLSPENAAREILNNAQEELPMNEPKSEHPSEIEEEFKGQPRVYRPQQDKDQAMVELLTAIIQSRPESVVIEKVMQQFVGRLSIASGGLFYMLHGYMPRIEYVIVYNEETGIRYLPYTWLGDSRLDYYPSKDYPNFITTTNGQDAVEAADKSSASSDEFVGKYVEAPILGFCPTFGTRSAQTEGYCIRQAPTHLVLRSVSHTLRLVDPARATILPAHEQNQLIRDFIDNRGICPI